MSDCLAEMERAVKNTIYSYFNEFIYITSFAYMTSTDVVNGNKLIKNNQNYIMIKIKMKPYNFGIVVFTYW